MLTRIKVKNYKGFKDAEIPIKPITILLGANSSGKVPCSNYFHYYNKRQKRVQILMDLH